MDKIPVVLKPGKEKSLMRRHPWIFSGAIESSPSYSDGEVLPVHSFAGEFLAYAYFHSKNSIAGRVLCFENLPIEEEIKRLLLLAVSMRKKFFDPSHTNCYRLINAEADGLPGLVIDCYDDVLVMQVNTCGMERLKPLLIENLLSILKPRCLYEKSLSSARRQDGLEDVQGLLFGEDVDEVEVIENGIKFLVSIKEGQKTGLFLDQREMRSLILKHSLGKRVLNCFSYTGGFSLFALKGGAERVDSIDICHKATLQCRKNTLLNGFDLSKHNILQGDVFDFLRKSPLDYDIVILDPPAFAKKRGDVNAACAGYKEINRTVFEKVLPGTLVLSCSCSYYIDEDLFKNLLFQAASEAKKNVKIISRHFQAFDHPVSLYHPEGDYLKSFLLYVE